jgi:hypothetical protein
VLLVPILARPSGGCSGAASLALQLVFPENRRVLLLLGHLAQRLPGHPAVRRRQFLALSAHSPLLAVEVMATRTSPIIVMRSAAGVERLQDSMIASSVHPCYSQVSHKENKLAIFSVKAFRRRVSPLLMPPSRPSVLIRARPLGK